MTATKESINTVVARITELDPDLEVKWSSATQCWYVSSRLWVKAGPNSAGTVCPHRKGFYEAIMEFFGCLVNIPTTSWIEIADRKYRWDGTRFKEQTE